MNRSRATRVIKIDINFARSVEEEDSAEFSMINPNLLDLDLDDIDNLSMHLLCQQ